MKELLEFVVKSIVRNKDDVRVEEKQDGKAKIFYVYVNKADIGGVIGKGGNTAQAIRTIVKSFKSRERVVIKFDSIE
ncbi:MAG: KH domain-containing protein [Clostridia bacterium]|nr:KH domain-containing protein [Clostridia bacterium]